MHVSLVNDSYAFANDAKALWDCAVTPQSLNTKATARDYTVYLA